MSNEAMETVTNTISLDFARKTAPVTVYAKQGDDKTRVIHIQPTIGGVPVSVVSDAQYSARFAERKPDGKYVYNDSAQINDDGTITVTLTDQSLAAHGNATCCIVLESQVNDSRLTSQNFTLIIEYSPGAYENLASSDEITDLGDLLEQARELLDQLSGANSSSAIYHGKVTTSGENIIAGDLGSNPPLFLGAKYKVVFDGTEYETTFQSNGSYSYLGNGSMLMSSIDDTGEPFCVARAAHATLLVALTAEEHTLTIIGNALPEVTPDDNGKFVRVVGGVYALVDLQDVSEEGL